MVFIIQARNGSSRLPNKMMIPFYQEKTIPEVIITRLQEAFPFGTIIVASTDNEKDDTLVENLQKYNVKIFRGSESDVLSRFIDCGQYYDINRFVRICADNPFLDMVLLKELIDAWSEDLDYLAHQVSGTPSMKTGYGFFSEISKMATLKKVQELTRENLYREHVTNYIYKNESKFKVRFIEADKKIAENEGLRLTVDSENDFKTAVTIYNKLAPMKGDFTYTDVIDMVKHTNVIGNMRVEGGRNKK